MNYIEAIIGGQFGVFKEEADIEKVPRYIQVYAPVTESGVVGDGHAGDLVFPVKTYELNKGIVAIAQAVFIGIFENDFVSFENEIVSFCGKIDVGFGLLLFKFGVTTLGRYLNMLRRRNDSRVDSIVVRLKGLPGQRTEYRTEKNQKETPHLAKIGLSSFTFPCRQGAMKLVESVKVDDDDELQTNQVVGPFSNHKGIVGIGLLTEIHVV